MFSSQKRRSASLFGRRKLDRSGCAATERFTSASSAAAIGTRRKFISVLGNVRLCRRTDLHPVALSAGSAPAPGAVVGASPTTPGALALARRLLNPNATKPTGEGAGYSARGGRGPKKHTHALRGRLLFRVGVPRGKSAATCW